MADQSAEPNYIAGPYTNNRRMIRTRQHHHPFYTKSRHRGREWWRLREQWIENKNLQNPDLSEDGAV
jgi:hypothetical protein